jgi:hypothetical protein
MLNTNAGRRGRGRVYSVERQSAIDMIVKPKILGLRGIHDVFTVLVEDVHVIIVPVATDTVLVNKLMIMTILPHGPKLVDVSMVTEEQRIGGGNESPDVTSEQVVRVGMGQALQPRPEASIGTVGVILHHGLDHVCSRRESFGSLTLQAPATAEASLLGVRG